MTGLNPLLWLAIVLTLMVVFRVGERINARASLRRLKVRWERKRRAPRAASSAGHSPAPIN